MFKIALVGCAMVLLGSIASAQDDEQEASEATDPHIDNVDISELSYPDEGQPQLGPTDAEEILNNTMPTKDAIWGDVVLEKFAQWKLDLYEKSGLKLGFNVQTLYQSASEIAPFGEYDTAWGYWLQFPFKWTPVNRGEDYEGSLVLVSGARGSIGNNAFPAEFGNAHVGSLWPTNFGFTSWPFVIEELYWEQWFKKDRLMVRAGTLVAAGSIDLFRFKNDRISFTSVPFGFHTTLASAAQGPGITARWWPVEGSEFYLTGVVTDVNGHPNAEGGWAGLDFGSFFKGEWFYALEIGKYWRRDGGEFDHVWLDLFYADERSAANPDVLPNEAGGGFKLMGTKQMGQWVGFASYTYNTAEGGPTSLTFGRQAATAGVVYLSSGSIPGEIGMGVIWMKPHPDLLGVGVDLRNQTGFETYWMLQVTPNLTLTPGFQFIRNPSLNPTVDSVFMPHIKFSLTY